MTDAAPAERARQHYHALNAAGWSLRAIAAHAGVSSTEVSRFIRHGTETPHVTAGILGIQAGTIPTRTTATTTSPNAVPFVSRVGTVRRIQALLRMGWTHAEQRRRSGKDTAQLISQQGRWVTRTTHDEIAALYRDLSHRRGPSTRTAARAERLGYVSPAEWNDIDHDEAPEALDHADLDDVDPILVERFVDNPTRTQASQLQRAERDAVVDAWLASGRPWNELERITGWKHGRYGTTTRREAS